jgi:hypothetical protein
MQKSVLCGVVIGLAVLVMILALIAATHIELLAITLRIMSVA